MTLRFVSPEYTLRALWPISKESVFDSFVFDSAYFTLNLTCKYFVYVSKADLEKETKDL